MARREYQVFAKPGGATCNLHCRYCYYLDKAGVLQDATPLRMAGELLERYIVQHIELSPGEVIRFSWHGGEPTVLGLDYFRTIVALQRKHQPVGKKIANALVTNGTMLDEEWCRFLADEGFAVGLSLDGPAELHDSYRVTKQRRPTHARVMAGYDLLRRFSVPCDILCVVHNLNALEPLRTYEFFKSIGATYVGFLPLVVRLDASENRVESCSVGAEDYGSFLCTIFDEWVCNDVGRIMIQTFDEAARPIRKLEHALCIFRQTCGDIPVVERNGDVYSCDHFVDVEHRLGNIRDTSLGELLDGPAHADFGNRKRDSLPEYCSKCEVLDMCNGGCPKDRFSCTPAGEPGLNYLCPGYKKFFSHSRPVFQKLIPLWKSGASSTRLMEVARGEYRVEQGSIGRNEPCPCGSGKKYKRCCMKHRTGNTEHGG